MPSDLFYYSRKRRGKLRRGFPRRLRAIQKSAEEFEPDPHPDGYDFDHIHLDRDGMGGFGARARRITLEAHARVFRKLAAVAPQWGLPYQLFFSLPLRDAIQDAVYFHTPNPDSGFPAVYDGFVWGNEDLRSYLAPFLPEFDLIAGSREFNHVVYAAGVGEPLRPKKQPL